LLFQVPKAAVYNKILQSQWLKTIETYFLTVWRLQSESKVSLGPPSCGFTGELLAVDGNPEHCWLRAASIQFLPPLSGGVCVHIPFFFKNTNDQIRAHPNPLWLHLYLTCKDLRDNTLRLQLAF
jgi:hypothetical protein